MEYILPPYNCSDGNESCDCNNNDTDATYETFWWKEDICMEEKQMVASLHTCIDTLCGLTVDCLIGFVMELFI